MRSCSAGVSTPRSHPNRDRQLRDLPPLGELTGDGVGIPAGQRDLTWVSFGDDTTMPVGLHPDTMPATVEQLLGVADDLSTTRVDPEACE